MTGTSSVTNVKQEHQTSEMALQNGIETHEAEIERSRTEAETSLHENTDREPILESEKGVLSAQNAQQETMIEALRDSPSQQTVQHVSTASMMRILEFVS